MILPSHPSQGRYDFEVEFALILHPALHSPVDLSVTKRLGKMTPLTDLFPPLICLVAILSDMVSHKSFMDPILI